MRAPRRFLIAALAAMLTSCATRPPPASVPVALEELAHWQARGRIGISGPEGGGSGSFLWQQQDDRADVQIRGPVGVGSVRLQVAGAPGNPELRLQTGDGVMLEAQAAWSELEARLGATLPAANLRYWLLGLAAPGAHRWSEPGADGEISLEQQGWRIDYQRYSNQFGARLPVRLLATSGAARVRIVVDRWMLGP